MPETVFVILAWSFWATGLLAVVGWGASRFWRLDAWAAAHPDPRPPLTPAAKAASVAESPDLDALTKWIVGALAAQQATAAQAEAAADAASMQRVRDRVLAEVTR
jgi:hypothetical protein